MRARAFHNDDFRELLLDWLPPGGTVLDVGCARGDLLRCFEGVASRRVGIEIAPEVAAHATEQCDQVLVGDALQVLPQLAGQTFDLIVCGDVLEHTSNPLGVLRALTPLLAPGGNIVASIPNVANWQIRLRLLRGRWDYEQWGIMDATHVRFFTLRTAADLFRQAGLEIVATSHTVRLDVQLPRLYRWLPSGAAARLEQWLGRLRPSLFAFQMMAVTRPAAD